MPYIPQIDREAMEDAVSIYGRGPGTAGELNYQITKLLLRYIDDNKLSYQIINDTLGALEGAKLEFYARVVRPYEDKKIKENGDVY